MKKLQVGKWADRQIAGGQADRLIGRRTGRMTGKQASKQGMASEMAHKTSYHILMCGTLAQNGMRKRPDADQEEKAKKSSR